MNSLVTELVALAIRHLNQNNPNARPHELDNFISAICTGKTIEQRQAENVVATASQVVGIVKKASTNRKFNKLISKI